MKSCIHALLLCLPLTLPAAVIVNVQEVGGDVVMSASGTLNTSGLTVGAGTTVFSARLYAQTGSFATGSAVTATNFNGFTAGGSFGTGGFKAATSGSGDYIYVSGATIGLSSTYVSGSALSATNTFAGTSLSSLGLVAGSYVWSWSGDSITLNIASSTIPESSTYALLIGAGAFGFCVLRRRRRV